MTPLLKVLLWLALPVAVCVWAVAHGQETLDHKHAMYGPFLCDLTAKTCICNDGGHCDMDHVWPLSDVAPRSPTRPNVPGAVLTDDVRKICRRGYAASVRPPEWASEAYKRMLLSRLPATASHDPRDYELDDLEPLEIGGAPGPKNWWLQKIDEARSKDREEDAIHKEVCAGRINIHDAQKYFLNWPDGTLQ